MTTEHNDQNDLWEAIRKQLSRQGIDLDVTCCAGAQDKPRVICVAASLGDTARELAHSPRDQVVMVRMDKESVEGLDAWVEAGVAKSRSEAAALFLKEGLRLRARELSDLKDALANVEEAKRQLRERAKDVLGDSDSPK